MVAALAVTALCLYIRSFVLDYNDISRSYILNRKPLSVFGNDFDSGWILLGTVLFAALSFVVAALNTKCSDFGIWPFRESDSLFSAGFKLSREIHQIRPGFVGVKICTKSNGTLFNTISTPVVESDYSRMWRPRMSS